MLVLVQILFLYFVPAAAIAFFIVSLCLYISARRKNKAQPGSISLQTLNTRKIMLIISSVIFGVLALVVIGFIALMFMAVAFM